MTKQHTPQLYIFDGGPNNPELSALNPDDVIYYPLTSSCMFVDDRLDPLGYTLFHDVGIEAYSERTAKYDDPLAAFEQVIKHLALIHKTFDMWLDSSKASTRVHFPIDDAKVCEENPKVGVGIQ